MEKEIHPMVLEFTTKKGNQMIKLPLAGDSLNVQIDWGDGSSIEVITSIYPVHKYVNSGVYEVKINGTVPSIDSYCLSTSERQYLIGIKSWGKLDGLISMVNAFYNYKNLRGELPNDDYGCFENVTDFGYCFGYCSGLTSIPENLFSNCPNVKYFCGCFYGCTGLTGATPVDILEDETRIELWERAGKEGYRKLVNGSACFKGCTGLSNYLEIPDEWKLG